MTTFIHQDQPDEWTAQFFREIEEWFRERHHSEMGREDAGEVVAPATRQFDLGDHRDAVHTGSTSWRQ